jgi:hypothetical protein
MRSVIILLLASGLAWGQTTLEKSHPVAAGQKVELYFDYPELIRISTWDKNEVQVTGTVSINGGENDEAFVVESSAANNTVYVRGEIRNLKNLPQRITVTRGDEKITFKSKEDYRAYRDTHGADWNMKSYGLDLEIKLDVKVPRNAKTRLESVYGMVEVTNFQAQLVVEATYGGVDVTVEENKTGEVVAETNYGQIFSNLSVALKGNEDRAFHTYVSAKPGNGPRYAFESKYGNVYLRKPR